MLEQPIITFISENKLFKGISHDALLALAKDMAVVNLSAGDYLMREGDPASDMYLLYQGLLRIYSSSYKRKAIADIGVGAVVGELALLTEMPRTADVRAVRDSTLIRISQDTLRSWVNLHPESAMKMVSDSIKRLLPGKGEHIPTVSTVALLPGEEGLDIKPVARSLMKAIAPYKKYKLLSDDDAIIRVAIDDVGLSRESLGIKD